MTNEFELIRERQVPEIDSHVLLYRHARLGTELLSVVNQDENKVFGITFRTPPENSTGVAHILEHSVLCGSERFPARRPFVELRRGSLHTFLNAFTSPDKTSYPVASQNLQDFYNLIDVYVDAVLHPLLPRHILDQEGWRHEFDAEAGKLIYKGVVFNEMKGVYSEPDNLLSLWSRRSLFPDNTYQFDSGGDPHEIPQLTYPDFKAFHEKYYHPSNARLYFYGDDPPDRRLTLFSEYLADFQPAPPDSRIPSQRPLDRPTDIRKTFAAGVRQGKNGADRLTINWLLPIDRNVETVLAFQVLDHILMGTPGSPLRKRLIDSGLGEDLTGYGSSSSLRQIYFSVGLKGIHPSKTDAVVDLVMETLADLSQQGFDQETIEASINTVEFRLRELNTGSYPRGLLLMLWSMNYWLHDEDPIEPLAFEAPLAQIKEKASNGTNFFEALIEKHLIQNHHRTVVRLSPDAGMAARLEKEEQEQLSRIQQEMDDAELERLVSYSNWLREQQETPDPPDVLAKIPGLRRQDLDTINKSIPTEFGDTAGVPTLFHALPTNGIFYLDLAFNLHSLRQEDLPLLRLFGRAVYQLGTKSQDYVQLSRRISRLTGGIWSSPFLSPTAAGDGAAAWWLLRAKATEERIPDMFEILQEVLLEADFSQRIRFRQMVEEERSGLESSLIRGGHAVVGRRLRARFDEASWIAEQTSGVDYLFFLRNLLEEIDRDWESVQEKLSGLRNRLISSRAAVFNVTAGASVFSGLESRLASFVGSLPDTPVHKQTWLPDLPLEKEALAAPTQVNFVGKAANLYDLGYQHDGAIEVILKHLRSTWLWEKVRVRGGAYGAGVQFNRHSGLLNFFSYRDPNIGQTIEAFDGSGEYLRDLELEEREITKSVIGTIGDMDAYLLPDAKGFRALIWYLTGDNEEARQKVRDEVLSANAKDFHEFAGVLAEMARRGLPAVLASRERIQAENRGPHRFERLVEVL